VRSLDWQGIAMVEYRYDPVKDDYWFMEVNGRFWGSFPLATASGVPFAWGLVKCCGLGEEPPAFTADAGRLCRYFIPEAKRLVRILFQQHLIRDPVKRFSRGREFFRFLQLYLNPRVKYFVFDWSDPKPFLVDSWYALRKAVGR
jgi:predicted ATP-grasp superfamily ATP-dependent carboligase